MVLIFIALKQRQRAKKKLKSDEKPNGKKMNAKKGK